MSGVKRYKFKDPIHGEITVVEHKHGMMMTNAKYDNKGRWVKRGNEYRYELAPNQSNQGKDLG